MPKCKYCHENITRFDKEICPFCGSKKPLEGIDDATYDITQCIDIINNKDKSTKFAQKKRTTNALLCMFLGFFGADAFYLGFKNIGIIRMIINIILASAISLALFFLTALNYLAFIIGFGSIFAIYLIFGIANFFIKGKKDANGVFVR